jgi:hypothetical protein
MTQNQLVKAAPHHPNALMAGGAVDQLIAEAGFQSCGPQNRIPPGTILVEATHLGVDTCRMEKKPGPSKPISWTAYKIAAEAFGWFDAPDEP